jgi:hypothetical protein
MDFKIIYVLTIFLFLFSFVSAFPVNVSDDIEINTSEVYFLVEVTNNSSTPKELTINFFAPTDTQIIAPKTIEPNSTINAKIFVRNDFKEFIKVNSTLEVFLGENLVEKEIQLRFYPTQSSLNPIDGLFGFFTLLNFEFFSEFSLILFLSLIVIILLVALIIRAVRK